MGFWTEKRVSNFWKKSWLMREKSQWDDDRFFSFFKPFIGIKRNVLSAIEEECVNPSDAPHFRENQNALFIFTHDEVRSGRTKTDVGQIYEEYGLPHVDLIKM